MPYAQRGDEVQRLTIGKMAERYPGGCLEGINDKGQVALVLFSGYDKVCA